MLLHICKRDLRTRIYRGKNDPMGRDFLTEMVKIRKLSRPKKLFLLTV